MQIGFLVEGLSIYYGRSGNSSFEPRKLRVLAGDSESQLEEVCCANNAMLLLFLEDAHE